MVMVTLCCVVAGHVYLLFKLLLMKFPNISFSFIIHNIIIWPEAKMEYNIIIKDNGFHHLASV